MMKIQGIGWMAFLSFLFSDKATNINCLAYCFKLPSSFIHPLPTSKKIKSLYLCFWHSQSHRINWTYLNSNNAKKILQYPRDFWAWQEVRLTHPRLSLWYKGTPLLRGISSIVRGCTATAAGSQLLPWSNYGRQGEYFSNP